MIAHIVLFKPKADVASDQRRALAESLRLACLQAASVRRAMVGRIADLGAGYAKGFGDTTYEYVAILEFDDRAGLMAYFAHPLHEDLARRFWETCESTVIIDVDGGDPRTESIVHQLV